MQPYDQESLIDDLSELLNASVSIDSSQIDDHAGIQVAIANVEYYREGSGENSSRRRYRHTVALLVDTELELPQFSMRPKLGGVHGMLLGMLGNMGALSFDDTPRFSASYQLFGWNEEALRLLFSRKVRERLADRSGWVVQGSGKKLLVYQDRLQQVEAQRQEFIRTSLDIAACFQDAETVLDQQPELRRETTAEDMLQSLDRMDGLAGGLAASMLKKQLLKIRISTAELHAFRDSAIPRAIPKAIQRQVVGDNFPLVILGGVFVLLGLTVGTAMLALLDSPERYIGLPFLLLFPVIGFCMSFFTLTFRSNKHRILTHGNIARGLVTDVQRTNVTVNNQVRHRLKVQLTEPQERMLEITAYGHQVQLARTAMEQEKPIDILLHPDDPSKAVCLGLLTVMD